MTYHFKTPGSRAVAAVRKHLIETKDAGDPFETLAKKFGQHADETLRRIKEVEAEHAGTREAMRGMEQMIARDGVAAPTRAKSWGEQFVESPGLKSFSEDGSRPGRYRVEVKDITTGATSAGAMAPNYRDSEVTTLARQRMTVRDLLSTVQMSGNAAEYIIQTSRPNGAATVAEGALKPESDMALELRTAPARVIAHWITASRQVLDDSAQLRDLIDGELRYGLQEAEEVQLLNGDGTGSNLTGLIPNATAFTDPLGATSPTMIDTIASAILQNALANLPAEGMIVHPADWTAMRTLKDTDGKYILGHPADAVEPRLFGLPAVVTPAIAQGSFLVGNFRRAATIYDRWQPTVQVSNSHDDYFVRNLVAILAEERLALAIKDPLALTYGQFPTGV
ncbi:phage major capsid protein [Paracoccus onubensis]|uniref:Phage major capsid protein n=1 Tax=Paracoccus onubensis TaxID=1675788 RepID=A0A418SRQ6_9RHOB|nr:phage major capsid protein [Paracoccus onubensis]RJE83646.1 phage major capsid protein [Paracoccus onubensis]